MLPAGEGGGDAAGHRVLVFAQLKGLLDLVERDVLKPAGVSFLRLDGSVEATQRFGVVRFWSNLTYTNALRDFAAACSMVLQLQMRY